uniref:Amiloride-sensitive sodium channel subunit beta n=1 Tax=Petromyzon marinus TaxID=7757 RepID=S4RY81_PETMA
MKIRKYLTRSLHRLQKGPVASVSELLYWYCMNTNTHGCKRIVVYGKKKRVLWFLITIIMLGVVLWQWVLLFQAYLSYGVSVSVNMGFQRMNFPAVTVCNLNAYRYSSMKDKIKDLEAYTRVALQTLYNYTDSSTPSAYDTSYAVGPWQEIPLVLIDRRDPNRTVVTEVMCSRAAVGIETHTVDNRVFHIGFCKSALGVCCDSAGDKCFYSEYLSGMTAVKQWFHFNLLSLLGNLSTEEKSNLSSSGDELIRSCLFSSDTCSATNFTTFFHPMYGNCFIFNWGENETVMQVSNPGVEYGLKLVLSIDQDEYIPFLTTIAGAVIMVHDQNTYPFLSDLGVFVKTGVETSVGIEVGQLQRQGAPYSDCTMDGTDLPITNLYNGTAYSVQACLRSCFQTKMIEMCGCGYYLYPLPPGEKYCQNQNFTGWRYCYYKLYEQFVEEDMDCYTICKQPCIESEYKMSISMSDWPSQSSEDWIFHILSKERKHNVSRIFNRKQDIIKLNLFFQEFNSMTISESPAQTIVTLLSNLGGQFGFWMGGSVLCIIEFIEIIIDCVWIGMIKASNDVRERRKTSRKPRYSDEPPTLSSIVQGQGNSGFEMEERGPPGEAPEANGSAAQPPAAAAEQQPDVPGTPPPHYDTLRISKTELHDEINSDDDGEFV